MKAKVRATTVVRVAQEVTVVRVKGSNYDHNNNNNNNNNDIYTYHGNTTNSIICSRSSCSNIPNTNLSDREKKR